MSSAVDKKSNSYMRVVVKKRVRSGQVVAAFHLAYCIWRLITEFGATADFMFLQGLMVGWDGRGNLDIRILTRFGLLVTEVLHSPGRSQMEGFWRFAVLPTLMPTTLPRIAHPTYLIAPTLGPSAASPARADLYLAPGWPSHRRERERNEERTSLTSFRIQRRSGKGELIPLCATQSPLILTLTHTMHSVHT